MSVVTNEFVVSGPVTWATATWANDDANPSYRIDIELQNFVNGIGDANKIAIMGTPGTATSRSAASTVGWILRCRDQASGDYGFLFGHHRCDSSPSNVNSMYYNRVAGSDNNGYGTYSSISISSNWTTSSPMTYFTAYETVGSRPWFCFSVANAARTARGTYLLMRVDTTNLGAGSYYPVNGLGKWIMLRYNEGLGNTWMQTPHDSITAPLKGTGASNFAFNRSVPTTGGYFFPIRSQYGADHWIGEVSQDVYLTGSTNGTWGDEAQIGSFIYKCLGNNGSDSCLWVKVRAV